MVFHVYQYNSPLYPIWKFMNLCFSTNNFLDIFPQSVSVNTINFCNACQRAPFWQQSEYIFLILNKFFFFSRTSRWSPQPYPFKTLYCKSFFRPLWNEIPLYFCSESKSECNDFWIDIVRKVKIILYRVNWYAFLRALIQDPHDHQHVTPDFWSSAWSMPVVMAPRSLLLWYCTDTLFSKGTAVTFLISWVIFWKFVWIWRQKSTNFSKFIVLRSISDLDLFT